MSTCLTFQRSLKLLCLGDDCAPYGIRDGRENPCVEPWPMCDREAWINAIACAEDEIGIDLGAPLCPTEICDELHKTNCKEYLRYKPVAYLGVKVYSLPTEVSVTYTDDLESGSITICPVDTEVVTPDNIVFKYPEIMCLDTNQTLPQPCITIVEDCDGSGGVGFTATWDRCELARPDVESGSITDIGDFLADVAWCYWEIDEDQAFSVVGECSCSSCNRCSDEASFDIELVSPELGEICFTPSNGCGCSRRRVLVNYATDYNCGRGMSPSLENAILLYAMVKLGKDKPCGCDNFREKINWWLSEDPSASQAFAKDIVYGSTKAGMTVWRTMLKLKKRRTFDEKRGRGGYFGTRGVSGFRGSGHGRYNQ